MPDIDFPYRVDGRGRTAETDRDGHIRDLIEEVLFTSPGERVNRPDFGTGLIQLVFAPNSEELAATVQLLVRSALQQWLGDRIRVDDVIAQSLDSTLTVEVRYTVLLTQEPAVARFTRAT
jgi:Bacteriophage baseplate protein W